MEVSNDFKARVVLVGAEVERRISRAPTSNVFELRARLWKQWLKRNVLDIPVSGWGWVRL